MKEDIKKLIELGKVYSNYECREISELDSLIVDIPETMQYQFYRAFMGNPHKFNIDPKWQVIRGKKPYNILSEYKLDELLHILHGVMVFEYFTGYGGGSVSSSVGVCFEIASLNYNALFTKLEQLEKLNYSMRYLPYGGMSKIAFAQYVYKYSNEGKIIEKMKVQLQVDGYIKFY